MTYKKRSPFKGVFTLVIYLLLFVVLVWVAVHFVKTDVPELDFLFNNTQLYVIILGVPMALFAGLTSYFGRGEYQRMIAGAATALTMGLYIYFVLGSLDLGWQEDQMLYRITPFGLLILLLIAVALKGVYHVLEYFTYHIDEKEAWPEAETIP
ncbi:MAG: hypothetical protein R6U17_08080 [Thermoplasmata archaeon]